MTAHSVWNKFVFFVALAIELLLLFVIFIILLIGVLGVFLPVIPGLLFVGLAAGIYSLILKSGYGTLSNRAHPYIERLEKYMKHRSSLTIPFVSKWWHATQVRRDRRRLVQYGLMLFTINTLLTLVFILSLLIISVALVASRASIVVSIMAPLGVIFVFAGVASIIWFRFGGMLGKIFHPSSTTMVSVVVLLSLVPLLILYGLLAFVFIFLNPTSELAGFVMGTMVLVTTFLALFEVFVVHLGATSRRTL